MNKAYLNHINWCLDLQRENLTLRRQREAEDLRRHIGALKDELYEIGQLLEQSTKDKAALLAQLQTPSQNQ